MTDPAQAPSPAPSVAAPATGLVYADVPNRAVAYIIDAIILAVVMVLIGIIVVAIGVATGFFSSLLMSVIGLAISAGYFIYLWTKDRATIGMRFLAMQVGNAPDGATLTTEQGVRRWLAISAPSIIAQAFATVAVIGWVLGVAAFAWFIFLVYTTATSPTKQGWHDHFANSMVVKAARSV
jgi:uncharacterized RDD family membrane protein YckC